VDDLGRDGVDNHWLLRWLLGLEGLWRLFRRRMRRRLPDLVGAFADFQRRRAGALELGSGWFISAGDLFGILERERESKGVAFGDAGKPGKGKGEGWKLGSCR